MVLIPYSRAEALTISEASERADRTGETMRQWAARFDLGRRVGRGPWQVSAVALAAFLDGDTSSLRAYLAGDRTSPAVVAYYRRLGIPVPSVTGSLSRSAA